MNQSRWPVTLWLATFLATIPPARAQQNAPHLAYVLPAGGQQGTTFKVEVGGQFLPNVTGAYVSGSGVQAALVEYTRPMNNRDAMQWRDRLLELQKQRADAAVQKEIADLRMKLFLFSFRRNTSPVLAEIVTLQITMAHDAEPGKRELRLGTPQGLSNPLVFCVGQLPEFTEKESVDFNPQPGALQPQIIQPATDMSVTLPATVNGRIKPRLTSLQVQGRPGQQFTPGDADRYRFQARQDQQLVVAVAARELIPYLADAVPGWFQATIALYDAEGKELAYEDDYRFNPDPVLLYKIPRNGEYLVEIKDSIYRGREDFVYRITMGELPFVTGIFPLGGRAGARTAVETKGWNLPAARLTQDYKNKGAGVYPISVSKQERIANLMPFAVDTLPEILEKESNNEQKRAQKVKLPLIVNGRIDQPGDWDVFRFEGRAGSEIVVEVYARRLNSPLDSVLKLTDANGRQLAFNDDHEDKSAGLETHHADSWLSFRLPKNGTYYLNVGDAQNKGGPEYAYRLRIGPPRPDFELRVVPSTINAAGGATIPITVYALRKDGFSGEISLGLKDAPRGFMLSGGWVPANQDQVRLTLTVPPTPEKEPVSLHLQGRAKILGREVVRPGVPAEDMMQAFFYRHLVPANDLKVAVLRRGFARTPAKIISENPVKIPAGGSARVRIAGPANSPVGQVELELSEPPEGIVIGKISQSRDGMEIELHSDAAKVKPGLQGNLIVTAFGARPGAAAKAQTQRNQQRLPLATLPAIPFEIIQK